MIEIREIMGRIFNLESQKSKLVFEFYLWIKGIIYNQAMSVIILLN